MRESLKCRDFRWYIENKVPSLAEQSIIGSGEVRNYHHQFCLDQQDGDNNVGLPVLVFDCTGLKGNQYWYYRSGESVGGLYVATIFKALPIRICITEYSKTHRNRTYSVNEENGHNTGDRSGPIS